MHQLDNICSSSVYGYVVRFAPERGQKPHAPAKLVPKRAIFGYFFANERPVASSIRHRWKRNLLCELQILSSWCTQSFRFVHRLGEPAADQLRGHLEQCISDRHTQPCRAADLGWQLWLQWRSHALACTNYTIFVVHRCMATLWDLPLSGARCPTPLENWSRNGPFSGTFSPMNALWRRQFDIDENETNCVNYKYCLVDAPGVSDSCID